MIKRKDNAQILTVPAPVEVLEGSRADVSFAAGLLMDKFAWHLPLYRQHQRLEAAGTRVSRQWLTPIERALRVIPMGRKSWLFCWTELGAKHVGIIQRSSFCLARSMPAKVNSPLPEKLQILRVFPACLETRSSLRRTTLKRFQLCPHRNCARTLITISPLHDIRRDQVKTATMLPSVSPGHCFGPGAPSGFQNRHRTAADGD